LKDLDAFDLDAALAVRAAERDADPALPLPHLVVVILRERQSERARESVCV
jgi:hypothetical protein